MSEAPGFSEISDTSALWKQYNRAQRIPVVLSAIGVLGILLLLSFSLTVRQLPVEGAYIWVPAVSELLVVWIVFLPLGYLAIDDEHIRIDFFYNKFPERAKRLHLYFVLVLNVLVIAALFWSSVKALELIGNRVSARGIPTYLVFLPVAIGMFMLAIEYVRQLGGKLNRDLW